MQARQQPEIKKEAKPSITALFVANGLRAGLECGLNDWFEPDLLAYTQRTIQLAIQCERKTVVKALERVASKLSNRTQNSIFKAVGQPGYDVYITMRKLLIRELIKAAVDRGVQQVCILAGGFDYRALFAAHEFPEVQFFELDRGNTREIKMQALQELLPRDAQVEDWENGTRRINHNLTYVNCDLAKQPLADALQQNGYDPAIPSLIVAEGLTMYLTEDAVRGLLQSFQEILKEPDEVLISFMTQESDNSKVGEWTRSINEEDYRFSCKQDQVCGLVNPFGLAVQAQSNPVAMLEQAGDLADVAYYRKKGTQYAEIYYSLHKDRAVLEQTQDISEVPDFKFQVPARKELQREYCSIQ